MKSKPSRPSEFGEICEHCGFTYGSHHGGNTTWPYNCCPGHEGCMNWEDGPGTVFKGSGEYKEEEL